MIFFFWHGKWAKCQAAFNHYTEAWWEKQERLQLSMNHELNVVISGRVWQQGSLTVLVRSRMTSYSIGMATPKTRFSIGLHEASCQWPLATSKLPDVRQTTQLPRALVQSRVVPANRAWGEPDVSLHHADKHHTHTADHLLIWSEHILYAFASSGSTRGRYLISILPT